MQRVIYFLLIICFCSGCGLKEREDAVQKKEAALLQKEQQLNLREKTLEIKEADLLKREQKSDTAVADTAFIYDARLIGRWNVKMTCTETDCPGSAVGDTKSETWDFSYQDNHLVVKATADEKLIRIYTGGVTKSGIELTEDVANLQSAPSAKLLVHLTLTNETLMEGDREIIRNTNCKTLFDLQINKQ